jgi:hypothetical protein
MTRKVIVIVKSVLRQAHEVLSVILLERIGLDRYLEGEHWTAGLEM